MPNTSTAKLPFFRPMAPAVQDLFDGWMQLADDCQNDRAAHVDDVQLLVSLSVASHFPSIMSVIAHTQEQSRMLEEESREIAYLLLKSTCTANV